MRLLSLTAAGNGAAHIPSLLLAGALILAAPAAHAQTSGETTEQPAAEAPAEPSGEAAAETTATETLDEYGLDTPLAEVDGTTVTLGEMVAIRRELPQQYQQLPDEVLYDAILEQLVNQLLLSRAARDAGVHERPEVALNLQNQQRAMLADAYLRAEVEKRATRDKLEALYEETYVNAEPVEEVKAAHILVESEELAREIKAKLDAGAEFAEMAQEYGTDGTKTRGGDLGWFTHSDMVPAFADAVFAMEPGTISDPVKSDFGWHLIKLEERRVRPAPPMEQVEAELMQEVVRLAQIDVVEELRAEAEIEMAETPPPAGAVREDDILDPAE